MKAFGYEKFKYFITFYRTYAYRHKLPLVLLFFGAILAGLLEILGILLLYALLKLMADPRLLEQEKLVWDMLVSLGMTTHSRIVIFLGLATVGIFIAKNLYIILYYHLQHATLKKWRNEISLVMMEKYLKAPFTLLLGYNSSTLIRNINGIVNNCLNGYILSALNYFSNVIVCFCIIGILLFKYPHWTLVISVILIAATSLQNYSLRKATVRLGKERDDLASTQHKQVFQGFVALKDTKVHGKEDYFVDLFKDINQKSIQNESKLLFLGRLPSHLTEITIIFAIVVLIALIVSSEDGSGTDTIATVGVLAAISFRLAPIMNRITSAYQGMNANIGSADRMFRELRKLKAFKQLENTPEIEKTSLEFKETIEFKEVSFKYPVAEKSTLENVSFKISKGEFIGVVGKSGAGKTTLIDILLGLLPSTQGQILIDNVPLTDANVRSWQDRVGYVPQMVHLNEESVANNVAFGIVPSDINKTKLVEALKKVDLWEKVESLPEKENFLVGESGKFFSGGERQRIALARAIYREASILILDEATASLDATTEGNITRAINALKHEKTIVTIAHRLSTLKSADKILFMKDGRVAGFESFRSLYQSNMEFREMCDLSNINDILYDQEKVETKV